MAKFSLMLQIDAATLKTILDLGEKIVIVKAVNSSKSQLVWVAIDPLENNEVTWAGDYALYARRTEGIVVVMVSTEYPTPSGTAYRFTDGGELQLTGKDDFPPVGTYRIFNEYSRTAGSDLAFGLIQAVAAGGGTGWQRASQQVIPYHQLADFTPDETVIVWLQSNVTAGDIVEVPPAVGTTQVADTGSTVKSRSTTIHFKGTADRATYRYDPSVGGFVPAESGS